MTTKPTFTAYEISDGEDTKYWHKVGAAWPHKDGLGFNIKLFALPVNGKIVIRENKSSEHES
ncbi:hypothetical protein [Kiloniella sp.]|uniref:hypothetical protein n=1 Tax=Kiloniella sp. TaxID=1938587 RepID=UPI003B02A57F